MVLLLLSSTTTDLAHWFNMLRHDENLLAPDLHRAASDIDADAPRRLHVRRDDGRGDSAIHEHADDAKRDTPE